MIRRALKLLEQQMWAHRAHRFVIREWGSLPSLTACADALAASRGHRTILPIVVPFPARTRVLVIAPHPDDEMIGPGGTVIGAIDSGSLVRTLYLTSGSSEPAVTAAREQEACATANSVGPKKYWSG